MIVEGLGLRESVQDGAFIVVEPALGGIRCREIQQLAFPGAMTRKRFRQTISAEVPPRAISEHALRL
jgi:hypothetical protein